MVRIDRLREDSEKRILRCSEGRRILGKGRIKEILDIIL